jgi:OTU domain-containing protein 6
MASNYIRQNPDEFAPFIGCSPDDPEFESYCEKVASEVKAEWGGQVEIKALSECLKRPIYVYSSNAPLLKTGAEFENESSLPVKISFHRHLYTLGEHYNSVVRSCC